MPESNSTQINLEGRFALLELGSNSLKVHEVFFKSKQTPQVETHRLPWRVAHLYFGDTDDADSAFLHEVAMTLCRAQHFLGDLDPSTVLCLATGVFRDLPDFDSFALKIREQTGFFPRLFSGDEEASLLAGTLRKQTFEGPLAFFDIGGASLNWVWLKEEGRGLWGSLPIGSIRNEYHLREHREFLADYLKQGTALCDAHLKELPFHRSVRVVVTGGNARVLKEHFSSHIISLNALRHLTVHSLEQGPPPELPPERSEVFLSGLVIAWRIMVRAKAQEIYVEPRMVHDGLVYRLLRLLHLGSSQSDFSEKLKAYTLKLKSEMEVEADAPPEPAALD